MRWPSASSSHGRPTRCASAQRRAPGGGAALWVERRSCCQPAHGGGEGPLPAHVAPHHPLAAPFSRLLLDAPPPVPAHLAPPLSATPFSRFAPLPLTLLLYPLSTPSLPAQHTASYDAQVSEWLWGQVGEAGAPAPAMAVPMRLAQGLRYGENPHQVRFLLLAHPVVWAGREGGREGLHACCCLHGRRQWLVSTTLNPPRRLMPPRSLSSWKRP